MIKRAQASKDAIIPFDTSDFDHFAAEAGRDYHLVFFLNAGYLQGNTQMNLPGLRAQYSLMAKVCLSVTHMAGCISCVNTPSC